MWFALGMCCKASANTWQAHEYIAKFADLFPVIMAETMVLYVVVGEIASKSWHCT